MPIADTMSRNVRLGTRDVSFPSAFLSQIADSSPLLHAEDGGASLRAEFQHNGFVYLRGALGKTAVLAAREAVLEHLHAKCDVLAPGTSVLLDECGLGCLPMLEGQNAVTEEPRVKAVLEGAPLKHAISRLLDTDSIRSFDYKWLRAMPRKLFTGAHVDAVYMARGTPRLLSCWIPIEPIATLELGALALYKGSHTAPGGLAHLRATYGKLDTESEPGFVGTGWFTEDPEEVARLDDSEEGKADRGWVSGDYSAGDVIIFGMNTLHMSTANLTDNVRISCDVRWQSAEEPIDERYTGTAEQLKEKQAQRKKGGAWAGEKSVSSNEVTINDLRAKWGLNASNFSQVPLH